MFFVTSFIGQKKHVFVNPANRDTVSIKYTLISHCDSTSSKSLSLCSHSSRSPRYSHFKFQISVVDTHDMLMPSRLLALCELLHSVIQSYIKDAVRTSPGR
jgi:hypothetical protein